MSATNERLPSIGDVLDLWKQRQNLIEEIEALNQECVGRKAQVDYWRHAEHTIRVATANLCYDLSKIFDIVGKMADTEVTGKCSQMENLLDKK
jgi:hypothetical protein